MISKWWRYIFLLTLILGCNILVFYYNGNDLKTSTVSQNKMFPTMTKVERKPSYKEILRKIAGKERTIILALVDLGFIDMVCNFFETSIAKFNIKNYLFVSLSKEACRKLRTFNNTINCFTYVNFDKANIESAYMSSVFLKKMALRTQFLADALNGGFHVLQTDTDVIFFKNPLTGLNCPECDMEIMEDGISGLLNAGFVYLNPKAKTIEVYQNMTYILSRDPRAEDQAVLNHVVKKMKGKFKYKLLDRKKYSCGKDFFEVPGRYFADTALPYPNCQVVHNNWIVSKPAKIYRFKEMLMWMYDGGQYYSSRERKYLLYNNQPSTSVKNYFENYDKNALSNALAIGQILNRTVILPRFHHRSTRVPLNFFIHLKDFDVTFKHSYRESTFLNHPKVPQFIKSGKSDIFVIVTNSTEIPRGETGVTGLKQLIPKDPNLGATSQEIFFWFNKLKEVPILRFHSLYKSFHKFDNEKDNSDFQGKIKAGMRKASYRQY